MGTVQIDGSTPKLTIGNATAEDATILFDGNAQDFYVGLDDSSDSLVMGLGSALGTTPAITINSSQVATFAQNPVFPDGSLALADLDIDGGTDIGAAIVDADLFIVDDGAGGTNRKTTAARIKTYAGFGVGDITGATELATIPVGTDELIINDGGALKRIDYAHLNNTPAFLVRINANQTVVTNTATKITFDTEEYDSDGAFASNKFVVPTGKAGMYQFTMGSQIGSLDSNEFFKLYFKLNGAEILRGAVFDFWAGADDSDSFRWTTSATFTLAADDYVEGWCYHNEGADQAIDGGDSQITGFTFMSGFRISGVI